MLESAHISGAEFLPPHQRNVFTEDHRFSATKFSIYCTDLQKKQLPYKCLHLYMKINTQCVKKPPSKQPKSMHNGL